ncbi:MAG: hypothetical protein H0W70_15825, partial [Actinobacteria bacterium]|nr:hypothetical protein [Actinomycetota bacterium]
ASQTKDGEGFSTIDGTVVGVVNDVDEDQQTHRAFEVLTWPRGRLRLATLTEADLDVDCTQLPEDSRLRTDLRRLAQHFYRSTQKRGPWDSEQLRAAPLIHLLVGLLQGIRTPIRGGAQ